MIDEFFQDLAALIGPEAAGFARAHTRKKIAELVLAHAAPKVAGAHASLAQIFEQVERALGPATAAAMRDRAIGWSAVSATELATFAGLSPADVEAVMQHLRPGG